MSLKLSGKTINLLWDTELPEEQNYTRTEIFEITGGILHLVEYTEEGINVEITPYDHHNEPRVTAKISPSGELIEYHECYKGTKYDKVTIATE